jgi:hypothetical protein
MKNITILLGFLFLLAVSLNGQDRKIITVKAGTKVIDYFPVNERFRYPEFIQGKVMFKSGNFTVTKLNYNILVGEMQFIQGKDTLAIINAKDISFIQIMQDTFYFDNGYLEVLTGRDPAIMTVKQFVKLTDKLKEGAYGTKSSTTAVQSYSGIYDQGGRTNYHLVLQEDLVFSRNTDYYIGNPQSGFSIYKKKNVLKLVPQHKSEIEQYLKQNKVDFQSREDLVRLTTFIGGIR